MADRPPPDCPLAPGRGVYPEGADYWLAPEARFYLPAAAAASPLVLEWTLACGRAERYDRFPLTLQIRAGFAPPARLTFAAGGQTQAVRLAVAPSRTDVRVRLTCDASFTPYACGLSEDLRMLSLYLSDLRWHRPPPGPPRATRRPVPKIGLLDLGAAARPASLPAAPRAAGGRDGATADGGEGAAVAAAAVPTGLAALAALGRQQLPGLEWIVAATPRELVAAAVDLAVVELGSCDLSAAHDLGVLLKRAGGAPVVARGAALSARPQALPAPVDVAILDGGDTVLLELAAALGRRGGLLAADDLHRVPGLVFRERDQLVATQPRRFRYITDAPDFRHLADRQRYRALYEEVGTTDPNQAVRWREEWMRHFAPRPGAAILELGAHNGPNLLHYARLGHQVVGVELSRTLIATFARHAAREPDDVRARMAMVQGWIEEYEPPHPFPHVLVTEVLEHVIDPVAILRAARRAVAADGEVYVTSPATHWGNNTHVRGVPADALRAWLDAADLEPARLFEENGITFAVARPRPAAGR